MGYNTETGFNTTLAQKLDAGVADATITLGALPMTITEGVMLIGSGTNKEWAYFATTDAGNVQITGVNRGLDQDAALVTDTTTANILSHRVGDPVRLVQHSSLQNVQFKLDSDNTVSGDNTFTGINDFDGELNIPIYADAAARDAAITSPREGSGVKLTTEGIITDYLGGAWATRTADTTANASETVTGRVQLNTAAQTTAATDTDGGDPTVNQPSETARVIQDGSYIYGSSTAGTDTYVVTLVPAITAHTAGQGFILDADVTNTGACTINYNGIGAQNIFLPNGSSPNDGDIVVGPNILVHNGTDFILMSVTANTPAASISSQAGTVTSSTLTETGPSAGYTDTENLDIDVTPFSSTDTVLVHYSISMTLNSTNFATNEYNNAFIGGSILMGAASSAWQQEDSLTGTAANPANAFVTSTRSTVLHGTESPDTYQIIISPDGDTNTLTVATPVWSGTNLRCVATLAGDITAAGDFVTGSVGITVLAIRLAQ